VFFAFSLVCFSFQVSYFAVILLNYFQVSILPNDAHKPIISSSSAFAFLQESSLTSFGYVTEDGDGNVPITITVKDEDDTTSVSKEFIPAMLANLEKCSQKLLKENVITCVC